MIGFMTQYLTRRYGFTATFTRMGDGITQATLTRRSPGLIHPKEPRPIALADDERFSAATRADALAACRRRIIELDSEILSEIREDTD